MSELLEMIMMICFGVSWPLSIIKSFTARTTTGKSVVFLVCIFTGYICGIASKLMQEKVTYVKVTPEMVGRIVAEHIVNGRPVEEYTIGAAQ